MLNGSTSQGPFIGTERNPSYDDAPTVMGQVRVLAGAFKEASKGPGVGADAPAGVHAGERIQLPLS